MKLKRKICVLFVVILSAFQFTGCEFEGNEYGTANVPPMVEQWRSLVEHYAEEYGIPEYVELILAMIMQESGGNAEQTPDIMQCSESAGMSPNAIDDPEVSIRQGVKYLATRSAGSDHIDYDAESGLYWMVASPKSDGFRTPGMPWYEACGERRRLELFYSRNGLEFRSAGVVAEGLGKLDSRHYASLLFDGSDLLVFARSGDSRAKTLHDGNLLTLHRVKNFRDLV